jgi:short-subunit dehydrogenase
MIIRETSTNREVALITGASSGLGAEFARALAARKYDLVLVARRRDRLADLAAELSGKHGIEAQVLAADLANCEDVEAVANRIAGEKNFALLVNNAGFGALGDFHEAALAPQMDMHRVHILAPMRLTHAALPGLVARDRGGVINVSSVAAFARMPGHASYNATKTWMNAFSECLHLELQSIRSRVRVQALCPGYTLTEFHDVVGLDRHKIMANRGFWMKAEFVVAESLKALDRGDWLVVPGWRYRMIVSLLGMLPHFLLHPIQMRVARKRQSAAAPALPK